MEPEKSVKTFGSDLLSEETAVELIVDSISNLHLKDSEQKMRTAPKTPRRKYVPHDQIEISPIRTEYLKPTPKKILQLHWNRQL